MVDSRSIGVEGVVDVLVGDLEHVSVSSVLQVCEMEAFTGQVHLGDGAVCHVHGGDLVGAEFGELRGTEAILEMFLGASGTFRLRRAEVAPGRPLGQLLALIVEGSRLLDEWNRMRPLVYARNANAPVPAGLERLFAGMDGRRPMWALIDNVGLPRCRVVDPIIDAYTAGHLEERGQLAESATLVAVSSAPGDLDVLLDVGRRCVRERDFFAAETAFRRALEVDPTSTIARQNLRRIEQLRSTLDDQAGGPS